MATPGPIQHVVILVKENHTFDNYFGTFPGANGATVAHAKNPPPDDPNHRHEAWMQRAGDTAHRVQYKKTDIPAYFTLAKAFTLCDNYFSEVAGPSTPNHLMLIAAAAPIINNPHHHYRPNPSDAYDLPSLPENLEKKGLTWANYGGYAFEYIRALKTHPNTHTSDQFAADAKAGHLPNVSWLYAPDKPTPASEHPTQNITDGMKWTVEQLQALAAGPYWDSSVVFLTYDDWGGWFDHVTPPVLEKWDSKMAQRKQDEFPQFNGEPFRLGSRVPCLVISPWAKSGYISTVRHSHVSLVRFCEDLFHLPTLNQRDAAADGMEDCFDFTQKPKALPAL
jgi:phospholipase C